MNAKEVNLYCRGNCGKHRWIRVAEQAEGSTRVARLLGTLAKEHINRGNIYIETKILPQTSNWFTDKESLYFIQDGAFCHTANFVKEEEKKRKLESLNIPLHGWPGESPDMNPIENLREILKRKTKAEQITTNIKSIKRLILV